MIKMKSLIELIFKGNRQSISLNFLEKIIIEAREIYFNSPELSTIKTFDQVVKIIDSNSYTDLAISTDKLEVYKKTIPKVFINLGCDNDEVDILFYFDLNDLNEPTLKANIDYLNNWAIEFKVKNGFDYFICQPDGNEDGYYFDNNGIGNLS